jgi:hypothetical protein
LAQVGEHGGSNGGLQQQHGQEAPNTTAAAGDTEGKHPHDHHKIPLFRNILPNKGREWPCVWLPWQFVAAASGS